MQTSGFNILCKCHIFNFSKKENKQTSKQNKQTNKTKTTTTTKKNTLITLLVS